MLKRNSINVHLLTRQPGLEIWCLSKVRTHPGGRIGGFGNFLIVFTKSPYLLPYIWQRRIFFWLKTRCIFFMKTFDNVISSIICCAKDARASIFLNWTRGNFTENRIIQSRNHPVLLMKYEKLLTTYFTSISHPYRGENSSETLSKIHVFITQTGNNYPEIGTGTLGRW